ncbi:MAG: dihydrodipicolinate synthase family protein [Pirellulaceae bacterium]|jgi:4-hydroxy-tetrahydrodipicolinate synthase|nr:dihydrodipicolinate synthase family protein [Pirellulaceae bacterium]MDP7017873.1 dihydrodipicolinate synthase family protein [Pirellulaceae bacterium]
MQPSDELRARLCNVHTYVVTPFRKDDLLAVDFDALQDNLSFLVASGVRVVAIGGGTGEFEALTPHEHVELTRVAIETVGQEAAVIATVPGNIAIAKELLVEYERLGVETVLGMPPLTRGRVPADLTGVVEYYRLLCAETSLPVMPYNTQGWPVEIFCRLAEIDGVVGVKDPCLNSHEMFKAIQQLGDRFIWIGNKRHDPGVVHLRYQMGMEAFTSGQSNFWPGPELELHAAAIRKDWPRMIELQAQCAPLERLRMLSDDAAMVKAAMDIVGLNGGPVRPPRNNITVDARRQLAMTLDELNAPRRSAAE